jgi:hypothetical protein
MNVVMRMRSGELLCQIEINPRLTKSFSYFEP